MKKRSSKKSNDSRLPSTSAPLVHVNQSSHYYLTYLLLALTGVSLLLLFILARRDKKTFSSQQMLAQLSSNSQNASIKLATLFPSQAQIYRDYLKLPDNTQDLLLPIDQAAWNNMVNEFLTRIHFADEVPNLTTNDSFRLSDVKTGQSREEIKRLVAERFAYLLTKSDHEFSYLKNALMASKPHIIVATNLPYLGLYRCYKHAIIINIAGPENQNWLTSREWPRLTSHEGFHIHIVESTCPTKEKAKRALESDDVNTCRADYAIQYPRNCEQWKKIRDIVRSDLHHTNSLLERLFFNDRKLQSLRTEIVNFVSPQFIPDHEFNAQEDMPFESKLIQYFIGRFRVIISIYKLFELSDSELLELITDFRSHLSDSLFNTFFPGSTHYLTHREEALKDSKLSTPPKEQILTADQSNNPYDRGYFGIFAKPFNDVVKICSSTWTRMTNN